MATAAPQSTLASLTEGPLYKAVCTAVNNALVMCECRAKCVGVATVPSPEPGRVTGLIGVHGKVSGFVTVNLAERFAIRAVNGLLQDSQNTLTAQVVDGVGEITNIIVGGIKSALGDTAWAFPHITVPSVIVGSGYRMAYAKGLEFLCVTFEHDDPEAVLLDDRLLQVSVSLLKL
jgi:chemotaxis protein CheX